MIFHSADQEHFFGLDLADLVCLIMVRYRENIIAFLFVGAAEFFR